ncbi:trypsin-like peptidase domain-containing protein [Streptomyces sp. NPDC002073]
MNDGRPTDAASVPGPRAEPAPQWWSRPGAPAQSPAGPSSGPTAGPASEPVEPSEPAGPAGPSWWSKPPLPVPAAPAPVPAAAGTRYDPWAAPLHLVDAHAARRRPRAGLIAGAVLLALCTGAVGGGLGVYLERTGSTTLELAAPDTDDARGRAPQGVAGIAARALPGVVTLHVEGGSGSGTGTGFVLDGKGHILTNNHVVDNAAKAGRITVSFSGGETASARIVGRDAGYDLAVVKVEGVRGLRPLPLGNSDGVRVGDPVVAIGAPFELSNTVTAGIISAKERPITAGGKAEDGSDISYVDALQTDAPINPGNSGGPLLDARGRVIGINSAIRSADDGSGDEEEGAGRQSGSIGLGFAIPINQGRRVAQELIDSGRATHPVIGVTLDMDYSGDGARVGTATGAGGKPPVTPGGPAAKAGIRPGDVITKVDGTRVHAPEELIIKIRAQRPGDPLALTVVRGGRERTVKLVLGSANGS